MYVLAKHSRWECLSMIYFKPYLWLTFPAVQEAFDNFGTTIKKASLKSFVPRHALTQSQMKTRSPEAGSSAGASPRSRWGQWYLRLCCCSPKYPGCPGRWEGLLCARFTGMSPGICPFLLPIFINPHYRANSAGCMHPNPCLLSGLHVKGFLFLHCLSYYHWLITKVQADLKKIPI